MKLQRLIYLLTIVCATFVASGAYAAETADQILAKCAQKVNNTPSISMKFVLSFDNNQLPCNLVISKEKYHLSSKDMQVWYDGVTQWTYLTATQQLSITEPTPDELMECNPFAILNHYKKAYTSKKIVGKGLNIELTAKATANSVQKAVISINPKTNLPSKVTITLSNGKTLTATAGTVLEGKLLPSKTFKYDKVPYPAKEITDLR